MFVAQLPPDPLRAYVLTLRKLARPKLSQTAVARAIGMTRRSYISWETGATGDLRWQTGRKLLDVIGGAPEHLDELDRMTVDEAVRFAQEWAKIPPDDRPAAQRARQKLRRIVELADDDPAQLERIIEQLRADARADPQLLGQLSAYLDGRRSPRTD